MSNLAIDDGKPVREKPFPTNMLGAALIGESELKELRDVVEQKSPFRHYGLGNPNKTAEFEQEAAGFLDSEYTLAVSSGSAALFCAAVALGLCPGDEVILPAFGWYSDYYCIVHTGATPVFADIDNSMNIDPDDFERKITGKTKAVIVIHYQGGAADMDRLTRIAAKHGIRIIEDVAQAFGGEYRGRKLGTIGDIAIASFQVNKILTCGEGGLVFTNDEECFARAVRYHDLGFIRPVFEKKLINKSLANEENCFAGLQFRMSELQGAFMLAQIRKLPDILKKCRSYHSRIKAAFENNPYFTFRPVPEGDCGITVFMEFKTQKEAKYFSRALAAEGIPIGATSSCTNILHKYPVKSKKMAFAKMPPFGIGFDRKTDIDITATFPKIDDITCRSVAIGIGSTYQDEDIDDIIKAINKVLSALYA